jgi:hypothetical protein
MMNGLMSGRSAGWERPAANIASIGMLGCQANVKTSGMPRLRCSAGKVNDALATSACPPVPDRGTEHLAEGAVGRCPIAKKCKAYCHLLSMEYICAVIDPLAPMDRKNFLRKGLLGADRLSVLLPLPA